MIERVPPQGAGREAVAVKAICIRCGQAKDFPWRPCSACGLDPQGDEATMVKSVYLSIGRFENEAEQRAWELELAILAEQIRRGGGVEFDKQELTRLLAQKHAVGSISRWHLIIYLGRVFMPGLAILAATWLVGQLLLWAVRRN